MPVLRMAKGPRRPTTARFAGGTALVSLLLCFSPGPSPLGPSLLQAGEAISCTAKHALQPLVVSADPQVVKRDLQNDPQYRQTLNQILYRDRRRQILIERARRALKDDKPTEAFEYLQTVFEASEDSFVWTDSSSVPSSARREASKLLGTLSGDLLTSYQRLYGSTARQMLAEARRTGDSLQFRRIARSFYHTEAGFHAADWLATRALDRGHFRQAAQNWNRLISDPFHAQRITKTTRLKAELSHRLGRLNENDGTLLNPNKNKPAELKTVHVTRKTVIPAEYLSQNRSAIVRAAFSSFRPHAFRKSQFGGIQKISAPYLKPTWRRSLLSSPLDDMLDRSFSKWLTQQENNLKPAATCNWAVLAAGKVFYRDFATIRALDLQTGHAIWKYRCATSPSGEGRAILDRYGRSANSVVQSSALIGLYARNSVLGRLTTDGHRVYAIDFMEIVQNRSEIRSRAAAGREKAETKLISREANRLIALNLDLPAGGANVDNKPIWSIGGAVGAPNWFYRMDGNDDGRVLPGEFVGTPDQFRVIDTNHDGSIRRTEAEASAGTIRRKHVLPGHFFLGPPVPSGGRLFVVTEADRQLNLIALKSETGEVLWTQGIGFVDRPIEVDSSRYTLACSPVVADGIVICPTQLGMMVGVDGQSGSLLWAYYYGDGTSRLLESWSRARKSYGHPGFPSDPLIVGNQVLAMPRHSNRIHSINLHTGRPLWTVLRGDAEYIGAVNRDLVFVVGRKRCRGLSLSTGDELWSTQLGMPAGVGIACGATYLLPVEQGRVVTVDLETGKEVGFSFPTEALPGSKIDKPRAPSRVRGSRRFRPGNLVADGGMMVSIGPRKIVSFPQSAALLEQLESRPMTGDSLLLAGELELILGHLEQSKSHLTRASQSPQTTGGHESADALMRELLFLELRSEAGNPMAILDRLNALCRTPRQRGRYLIQRAEIQLGIADFAGVLDSTGQFAALDLREPIAMIGDPAHRVSATSWIPSIFRRIQNDFGDREPALVTAHVDREQQSALASNKLKQLRRFLTVFSEWPQARNVRTELAARLIELRKFQEAELLLLQNRKSTDPHTAAVASRNLAELWDKLGLCEEAASLLAELEERFALTPLDDGLTGRRYVSQFPRDRLTALALRRLKSDGQPARRVEISEERWYRNNPQLKAAFDRTRREFLTPATSSFHLLDKSTPKIGLVAVIDKQTGTIAGEIAIPINNSYPPSLIRNNEIGHFVPLGGVSEMYGISLLELDSGKPWWRSVPHRMGARKEMMRVGPVGPSFAVYQSRRDLVVVDPSNGRTRWQRTDLDPGCGLNGDPYRGLFGDDKVLVLFAVDRRAYTVYRTATGEKLRQGRLDINPRHMRRVFGRRLFYVSGSGEDKRLRIWDPLEDRLVFDVPAPARYFTTTTNRNELVLAGPGNRLIIIDVATGQRRLELDLGTGALKDVSALRAFSDHRCFYINLQRRDPPSHSTRTCSHLTDPFLAAARVEGELQAVDRVTGKLLWKRTLPKRTILQTPHIRLPFLITVSRLRDRWNGNHESMLIEVIDCRTGHTIGYHDNLTSDRLLRFCYDPDTRHIELRGKRTVIDLRFHYDASPLAKPAGLHRPLAKR